MKYYEIRDPVHGFIKINEWEREVINHWVFQRLRRIRQLAWTELLYPGAMHTRFEHSLGVMHIATRMFEAIWDRQKDLLSERGIEGSGSERYRQLVRFASLLHDVGHPPLSHAGENNMPVNKSNRKYSHEDYSAAAIRTMTDVIDDHKLNHLGISADDIANLLEGNPKATKSLVWRTIISSQLDADRCDYLLRDSYHIGVAYGHYDLDRIINCICLVQDESEELNVAIKEGGKEAAEQLLIARYLMFTQVYFHPIRKVYDRHFAKAFQEILGNKSLPTPDNAKNLNKYLEWDDWKVFCKLKEKKGADHGKRIMERNHYRLSVSVEANTASTPDDAKSIPELDQTQTLCTELNNKKIPYLTDQSTKEWYQPGDGEILIADKDKRPREMSKVSQVIRGLKRNTPISRFFVPKEKRKEVKSIFSDISKKGDITYGV